MSAGPGKVYYFAPISTDKINAMFGANIMAGAASNKVLGLADALMTQGVKPVLVSTIIPGPGPGYGRLDLVELDNCTFARMRVPPSVLPRRLIASLGLAWLCLKTIRRNDVVILYNYFPEFLLAALILKLKCHPAFLDVEDAPNPDDRGLRENINRLCLPAVSALTRKEKIIVSHALAKRMGLDGYFVAYGVARQQQLAATAERQPGSILFGGSIMRETGLELFRDAVRILAARPRAKPLEFHVTGNFCRADFDALLTEIASSASVKLTLHADLTREDYLALTTRVQTGLSLKPARGVMGEATFPSKVVEIASTGMVLCATKASDVGLLFDQDSAMLLDQETGEELADALEGIAADPVAAARIAQRGRDVVHERFSPERVGQALLAFLRA